MLFITTLCLCRKEHIVQEIIDVCREKTEQHIVSLQDR